MKRLLCVALLLIAGGVAADELDDANRLYAAQAYDKALPIYQKLAAAGNAEAQLHLGEMAWFGDGVPANLDEAKAWFQKAATAGNADAAASLASLARRETHGDEIVYWTRTYDGADMVSGQFACKPPDLPFVSETKHQIKVVNDSMEAYSKCYNGFVDNLKAALPSLRRIPPETLDMMTPAEVAQARVHLDKVYACIAADARNEAMAFTVKEAVWWQKTGQFVNSYSVRKETNSAMFRHFGSVEEMVNKMLH